jgi:cell division protein FtsL
MATATKAAIRRPDRRNASGGERNRNRKIRPTRRANTWIWIMVIVLFFGQALFYAWCRVQCVNAGYGLDKETRRRQALTRERNTLNIELARLKSPERIETIARTRLGLGMPDAQQRITLP